MKDKVVKFAEEHPTFELDNVWPARNRGGLSPEMRDHFILGTSPANKLQRDPSQGTLQTLFEKSDQRKAGKELIERQVEIENMRANQLRIRHALLEREKSFLQAKHAIKMEKQIAAEKKQAELM